MNSDIRLARKDDLQRIVTIYNQSVNAGFETADTSPVSVESREEWFNKHSPEKYPIIVYETDGVVAGWLSVSPYREGRQALRFTAEISYYVDKHYKRMGIGSKLVEFSISLCSNLGYKTLFAIILDRNEPSIRLMKKLGFDEWGNLPRVADFDGVECGHVYYGLRFSAMG